MVLFSDLSSLSTFFILLFFIPSLLIALLIVFGINTLSMYLGFLIINIKQKCSFKLLFRKNILKSYIFNIVAIIISYGTVYLLNEIDVMGDLGIYVLTIVYVVILLVLNFIFGYKNLEKENNYRHKFVLIENAMVALLTLFLILYNLVYGYGHTTSGNIISYVGANIMRLIMIGIIAYITLCIAKVKDRSLFPKYIISLCCVDAVLIIVYKVIYYFANRIAGPELIAVFNYICKFSQFAILTILMNFMIFKGIDNNKKRAMISLIIAVLVSIMKVY